MKLCLIHSVITDNLREHYWNTSQGNEGAQEWTGGSGELNSSPTLEIILQPLHCVDNWSLSPHLHTD